MDISLPGASLLRIWVSTGAGEHHVVAIARLEDRLVLLQHDVPGHVVGILVDGVVVVGEDEAVRLTPQAIERRLGELRSVGLDKPSFRVVPAQRLQVVVVRPVGGVDFVARRLPYSPHVVEVGLVERQAIARLRGWIVGPCNDVCCSAEEASGDPSLSVVVLVEGVRGRRPALQEDASLHIVRVSRLALVGCRIGDEERQLREVSVSVARLGVVLQCVGLHHVVGAGRLTTGEAVVVRP